MRKLYLYLFILFTASYPAMTARDSKRVPAGGAPPPGSGPLEIRGPVRVIDGNTLEVRINGNQVGIGILGVDAPQGNTPCGREARDLLTNILKLGLLRLEEDSSESFDERKRRMYNPSVLGRSLALEMAKAGVARINGKGRLLADLLRAEAEARTARRGCVWRALNAFNEPVVEDIPTPKAERAATRVDGERSAAAGPALSQGFVIDAVASNFTLPTAFTFLPDGRILIAEQTGLVWVYKNGAILPTPLIDLRGRVNAYWDRGLIGMTADPNFASNGYLYFLYVYEHDASAYGGPKTGRLTRVTVSGDTANPSTETVLLGSLAGPGCGGFPAGSDCIPAESASHSVGNLRFAPDGTIFASFGDASSFNLVDDEALRAQNLDSLAGKIVRIAPDGKGLPTNPFFTGNLNTNRSKIWAYGVRNAFRLNLKPGTDIPYVGDVGWGQMDEVDVAARGANLGWPCYEGAFRQEGYEPKPACQALYAQGNTAVRFSVVEWYHGGISSAVTAGAFYNGTAYPAEYQGAYFYGDYGMSFLKSIHVDANQQLVGGPYDFLTSADAPTAIDMGPDQNLYYLALGTGELRRIRYVAGSDSIAPVITSVNPAESANNSLHTGNITATFSEGMNPATITGAFRLIKQSSGTIVAATVTYDTATRTATLDPNANLELAASYVATVQGGVGGVTDQAGNPMAATKTWTFTTATVPPSGQSYISDLGWTLTINGWGPAERDRSNGGDVAGDGGPLRLNGVSYTKGVGVHASSEIRLTLGGTCSTLTSDVGVDDEMGVEGSIVFQVWGDAVKLYDSGLMTGTTATKSLSVDLTGKNELRLIVTDGGDGIGADHGDWANARITCTGGGASDTTPPTISNSSPAAGATNVMVTSRVTAVFSEAMDAATLNTATMLLRPTASATPVAATVTYDAVTRTVTLAPSQALSTSVGYTATVKGGPAGVKDLAGNPLAADRTWTFQTAATSANTRYLSDLTWTSATNGWGPVERDTSNGDSAAGDGLPIQLNGVTYPKGLGVHAPSDVRFPLGGACSTFQAAIGVDDETGAEGSVNFQVWADGAQLFGSTLMTGATATALVNVDISGRNELRLVVTDGGDNVGFDHADWADARITCVSSNNKPVPTISAPLSTFRYKVGDVVAFSGSATDPEDGNIPAAQLSWAVKIHHCPGGVCHVHNFTTATGASGSFTVPDHGDDSYFEVILTALDSGGLSDSVSRSLQPLTVPLTLATNPAGLQVVDGGTALTAPVTWNSIVGSTHSIFAPSPQGNMTFQSWSDGKPQQHDIVVGTTAVTYTAVFTGTDTTPPVITSRIPASGGTNVAVTATVSAIFSESLQASTVTATTATLVRAGTTTPLAAVVSYDNATRTVTLTPSQPLLFATSYTATLKGGAAGIKDLAGNALVGDQSWTFQTANAPSFTKYVSDLSFTLATNSWGPVERDKSNGESIAGDGRTITLNGATYARGIGVHAHSDVRFQIGGNCSTFQADIGIDDEVGVRGSVAFQVWADGAQIFASSLMTGSSATVRLNLNVGGKSELRLLVTDGGNGIGSDHADWADARLTCTDTTAPVVSGTTPANAATGVSRTTDVTAVFAEEMKGASITPATVYLTLQGETTPVAATVSYSADLRRATLNPVATLQRNRQYTMTVKGGASGVKDLADLAMAADRVWTFTTVP